MFKIGHGFDVHAFDTESKGPLTMGGVKVPYEHNFLAHSDGDVLLHAICDALLGALALGDIGKHFPDNSSEFYKIDSRKLLKFTYELVKKHGWELVNLDSTILAQAPKFAPYINKIQETIANILETDYSNISVKATTTEKLGFTGRKEGIAAECVVLLKKA